MFRKLFGRSKSPRYSALLVNAERKTTTTARARAAHAATSGRSAHPGPVTGVAGVGWASLVSLVFIGAIEPGLSTRPHLETHPRIVGVGKMLQILLTHDRRRLDVDIEDSVEVVVLPAIAEYCLQLLVILPKHRLT